MGVETAIDGTLLTPGDIAYPCGLIAYSYARWVGTDFALYAEGSSTQIEWDKSENTWKSDTEFKFKNQQEGDWRSKQWMDVEDPDFMVWFSPAASTNFLKVLGKIEDGLPAGDYRVQVTNGWDEEMFAGQKNFVLLTTTAMGGSSPFLGACYLICGFVLVVLSAGFSAVYCATKRKDA